MTLATTPEYAPDRITPSDGHAVVIGASMGGIIAARTLADRYATVTVIDSDELPAEPGPRRGVPQSGQPHALSEAGRAVLESLFPGYGESIEDAGGLLLDAATDLRLYYQGGYLAPTSADLPVYSASRPLFEHVARQHLLAIENVEMRVPCQFLGYVTDDDVRTVTGLEVRDEVGERTEITADLVVDATGRTSRTPKWLEANGYRPPPVEEVHIDVGYSTVLVERPPSDTRAYICTAEHPRTRGVSALPIEGDRWIVTVHGVHGDHPPDAVEDFPAFAADVPVQAVSGILGSHAVVSEVRPHRYPCSRRHRYDELRRFPDGLVVFGDAIASFNPVYGQGMSAAALQGLVLHAVLADETTPTGPAFFERVAPVVENVWSLAVGADFAYPETRGEKPRGNDLFGRYIARLARRAHTDPWLSEQFNRVLLLMDPATALLRPRVLWRVFGPQWGSRLHPERASDSHAFE